MGDDYILWDKAASIRFRKPGTGKIMAIFHISQEKIQEMREEVEVAGKKDYTFQTNIMNEEGVVVAEVEKLVYVRKKDKNREKKDKS